MRSTISVLVLTLLLGLSAGAQNLDALIAEAAQPVAVELAIGVTARGEATEALAGAGLASAVPNRVAVLALGNPRSLEARSAAERELAQSGPTAVAPLVEADVANPIGLWIGAPATPEATRVRGQVRGLNLERVLTAMGPEALPELEALAAGSGATATRAQALLAQLSQLDVEILASGVIRVEGEATRPEDLGRVVASHRLARTARVVAPGDLPLGQIVPALDALRLAGLTLEIQASESAVVTISAQAD